MAMIAAAYRLPGAAVRARSAVEVEIRGQVPLTPPMAATGERAPAPHPEPRLALRTPSVREREHEREPRHRAEEPPERETPPTANEPLKPTAPPAGESRPPAALDLRLHNLPLGVPGGSGITVPEGGGGGAFISSGNRPRSGGWRPRGDAGDPITGKVAEEHTERFPLKPLGRDGYLYEGPTFSAHVALDGEVSFDDKHIGFAKGTSGGSFDLTDLIMKGKGEDSRRYEKQRFLEATADMRAKLAERARAERVRESLVGLPAHLESVWADQGRTARDRRRLLYALWKEAAAPGEEMGSAGAEARAIIEAFIRSRLPAGSDEGYSDDELAAYNRSGRLRFDPYRR
jgi:hypothetical protein